MRRIGKASAILALGLTVNLVAGDAFFSSKNVVSTQGETNNHLQINAGVIDLKHLDKKEGFIDIVYQNSSYRFLDSYPVAKVKLSSSYKDFWLINPTFGISSFAASDGNGMFEINTGIGYMMLDSKNTINKTILKTPGMPEDGTVTIHKENTETQKAPYVSFNAYAGVLLDEDMALSSSLVYKVAVDRADMKDGYSAGLKMEYKNWNVSLEHEKFDFKGGKFTKKTNRAEMSI